MKDVDEGVVTMVSLYFCWGEKGNAEGLVKHFRGKDAQAESDRWLAEKCKDGRYLPLAGTV